MAVARHDRAVLVRCGYQRMDGDGRVMENIRFRNVREVTSPPDTLRELLGGCLVSLAAFALRKDVWQTAGGFPEQFHLMGDWALWLRCAPRGDFLLEGATRHVAKQGEFFVVHGDLHFLQAGGGASLAESIGGYNADLKSR